MTPPQSSKAQSEQRAPFKVKLCRFYEHGACTRGSRCSFAHGNYELKQRQGKASKAQNGVIPFSPAPPGAAPWPQTLKSTRRQDGPAVAEKQEYYEQFLVKTDMCKFYAMGECARGSSCTFAHTKEELRPLPDLRPIKLCPFLIKSGTCTEVHCPYSHSGQEMEMARLHLRSKYETNGDKDTSYDSSSTVQSIAGSSSSTEPFDKSWDADSYGEPEVCSVPSSLGSISSLGCSRSLEPSPLEEAMIRFAKVAEPEFRVSVRNTFLTFTAMDQDAPESPLGPLSLRRRKSLS